MTICSFSQFSPGGNLTLFLQENCPPLPLRAKICARAMAAIHAEQVAFVDVEKHILSMAGDEFCVNATRAFGALLDFLALGVEEHQARTYLVETSGFDEPLELLVEGSEPLWQVSAILPRLKFGQKPIAPQISLVELPGIVHLLIAVETLPSEAEATNLAPQYIKKHKLEFEPAAGIVWYVHKNDDYEILPFVAVPEAATAMLESACGSGSLALALSTGGDNAHYKIKQPSGSFLKVNIDNDRICVSGEVQLLSAGELWLDMNYAFDEADES